MPAARGNSNKNFHSIAIPRYRKLISDLARLAKKKSTIYGMVEFDITETRKKIRQYRRQSGKAVSLTSFIISCLGKAVDNNPQLHGYKNIRNRLVMFRDVDLFLPIEFDDAEYPFPAVHILRAINRLGADEIESEIQQVKADGIDSQQFRKKWRHLSRFYLLPGFIRRRLLEILFQFPTFMRKYLGTVAVTAVGMFGAGQGHGLGLSNHALEVIIGGIGKKTVTVKNRPEVREMISITISVDHDTIDGAPGARFARDFRHYVESGIGLAISADMQ